LKLTKAYRNTRFLDSDEARELRILSEYLEPKKRLRESGVARAIVAFGSARIRPLEEGALARDFYVEAVAVAERLAQWTTSLHEPARRYHLVTGGGPGLMQAFHEGGARVDRRLNVGLGISLPFEQHGNPFMDEERGFEFHYFFMRKFWFMNLAKAVVIFPGGFGTLDELFEVLTLTQTGKSSRMPIVLYGKSFWEEVLNLPALARQGLISPEDLKLFQTVDSVGEAVAALTEALGPA
jgi:hypothetical protein